MWKPEGQRPIDSPRRRWEYNIKMDLPRIVMVGGGGACTRLVCLWRGTLLNTVMNLSAP